MSDLEMPLVPKFSTGWSRLARRIMFLVRAIHYLLRPESYPLFLIRRSRNGLIRTYELERELGLTKWVRFGGKTFYSLTLPHYPSQAFDFAVARGALNAAGAGTPAKPQVDNVILGVSRRCTYACAHCYEKRNIQDRETVPVERWESVIGELQEIGSSIIILSGGEPMLRYEDTLRLLRSGDKSRSDFHLHTSGFGVTPNRARQMKEAGLTAAAVGLDDVDPDRFEALRGTPGAFSRALRALEYFNRAGIFTYLNLCLTPGLVRSGDLWKYFSLAKRLNVGMVQILEPRPCGGFAGRVAADLFTDEDRRIVADFVRRGNSERSFRKHPLLYYVASMESPEHQGCMMGGLSHFSIDSAGNVIPCVFVPVSFGNIISEHLTDIFARLRLAVPAPVRRGCASVLLSDILPNAGGTPADTTVTIDKIRTVWSRQLA